MFSILFQFKCFNENVFQDVDKVPLHGWGIRFSEPGLLADPPIIHSSIFTISDHARSAELRRASFNDVR